MFLVARGSNQSNGDVEALHKGHDCDLVVNSFLVPDSIVTSSPAVKSKSVVCSIRHGSIVIREAREDLMVVIPAEKPAEESEKSPRI